jgi:coenzyme F420-reducing hydrogenase alpha subunit
MTRRLTVDVHHLTRVEGHGNINVKVRDGRIEEAHWQIVETPRFFEAMLVGKHFTTAGILASRICGICSISHCLAALRATERAFGVAVPPTADRLRRIAKHGETLQSHVLHLFFLAAPDFLSQPSTVALVDIRPDLVNLALRLKGLGNRLCDAVAGRTTHPVSLQPGGVAKVPETPLLQRLRDELSTALDDLDKGAAFLSGVELPDFERETEWVSLRGDADYPFVGGRLVSSDGVERDEDSYLEMTNEYLVDGTTSKWTRLSRDAFAVGPLARVNNNFELLHPEARRVASRIGLEPVCHRPFMAHAARLVECVHCVHDAIRLIDEILDEGLGETAVPVEPRAARGVGAVEAPRGILYHALDYDRGGRIVATDCVIPTTQNNGNIEHDLPALVTRLAGSGIDDRRLESLCSMLVRAYDPCISCAVH